MLIQSMNSLTKFLNGLIQMETVLEMNQMDIWEMIVSRYQEVQLKIEEVV